MSEDLIDTTEAGRVPGASKNWVTQLIRKGELAAEQRTLRGAPTWYLKSGDVETYLEETWDGPQHSRRPVG